MINQNESQLQGFIDEDLFIASIQLKYNQEKSQNTANHEH
jgi:hypothetical protein